MKGEAEFGVTAETVSSVKVNSVDGVINWVSSVEADTDLGLTAETVSGMKADSVSGVTFSQV